MKALTVLETPLQGLTVCPAAVQEDRSVEILPMIQQIRIIHPPVAGLLQSNNNIYTVALLDRKLGNVFFLLFHSLL